MMKEELDKYLEFDSKLLFNNIDINQSGIKLRNLTRIFGGAIRDIIAGQAINDIDIIVGAKYCIFTEIILKENGYVYMESLTPKDLNSLYSDISIINEPRTWMKGSKIVQLIRPVIHKKLSDKELKVDSTLIDDDEIHYESGFIDLIQNVDISCCGVSWDGETLYENYPNAILHCQNRIFYVNTKAKMYSYRRASFRKEKLISRGWENIDNLLNTQRDLRIDSILSEKPYIKYTNETLSIGQEVKSIF